ncbi:MAG: integrase core domain-containing protein, partial [Clostridiales bacterium]|nr:integrase core domain-containing protein [Clostridiales bacterium]
VRCLSKGYTRSFGSMCRQIRKKGYKKPTIHRKSYTNYKRMDGEYPGHKVQVDNGAEFVNDEERTDKLGLFQKIAESLGMQIRKTRPYSPWQNGKVERSHREDGKILYKRKVFTSERELKKQVQKHEDRYNRTAKTSLDFKSPNQLVEEYFSKCNICLDS